MKKATNQGSIRGCKEFAATDFKFLGIACIQDVEKKAVFWTLLDTCLLEVRLSEHVSKTNVHYLRDKEIPKYQTLITDH